MSASYPHADIEALLQTGNLQEALRRGWFGDEWSYRLVRAAAGHTLQRLRVAVDASKNLGVDLRNEDGVATIGMISPSGAIGRNGALRSGDVIRAVGGRMCFTCEAAVQAIKTASRSGSKDPLVIEAVRVPPTVRMWREESLQLAAGTHHMVPFETAEPACVTYSFATRGYDVGMSIIQFVGSARARRSGSEGQETLVDLRHAHGRGHVVLSSPGRCAR